MALRIKHSKICGYVEVAGDMFKLKDAKDLERLYQQVIIGERELQTEAALLINEAASRRKRTQKAAEVSVSVADLFTPEEYDTSKVLVHPFRTSDDEVDSQLNNLGNMCKGYHFEMNGYTWLCSESAYIAGLFSGNSQKHIDIQRELLEDENGYHAKKTIRQRNQVIGREDWETFNVHWMLYVVWSKCLGNQAFREMLLRTPANAVIIENSSLQNGITATFWGCKNDEWKRAKDIVEKCVEIRCSDESKQSIKHLKMEERQKINQLGVYRGVNCMGKILMICRQALTSGVAPAIDYDLLRSKDIHLFGTRLDFR